MKESLVNCGIALYCPHEIKQRIQETNLLLCSFCSALEVENDDVGQFPRGKQVEIKADCLSYSRYSHVSSQVCLRKHVSLHPTEFSQLIFLSESYVIDIVAMRIDYDARIRDLRPPRRRDC